MIARVLFMVYYAETSNIPHHRLGCLRSDFGLSRALRVRNQNHTSWDKAVINKLVAKREEFQEQAMEATGSA
jgi:hypothetical protein